MGRWLPYIRSRMVRRSIFKIIKKSSYCPAGNLDWSENNLPAIERNENIYVCMSIYVLVGEGKGSRVQNELGPHSPKNYK